MTTMKPLARSAWFALAAAAACLPALAAPCVKQSPAHAVALVELYTSEGCSSCPPADQWLSRLAQSGLGDDEAIALALHVDYWDGLGWKDRFADRRFSDRQRALSDLAGRRVIYTPEVFVNLREFRNWDSGAQFRRAVKGVNAKPAGADIRLALEAMPGAAASGQLKLQAHFAVKPGAASGGAQAFIAIYEDKLVSEVAAGENRGAMLHHDRVVRRWVGPIGLQGGSAEYDTVIPLAHDWNAKHLGVAAFVQDLATRGSLQATALGVCEAERS
jgi:hypothetical protein